MPTTAVDVHEPSDNECNGSGESTTNPQWCHVHVPQDAQGPNVNEEDDSRLQDD